MLSIHKKARFLVQKSLTLFRRIYDIANNPLPTISNDPKNPVKMPHKLNRSPKVYLVWLQCLLKVNFFASIISYGSSQPYSSSGFMILFFLYFLSPRFTASITAILFTFLSRVVDSKCTVAGNTDSSLTKHYRGKN